MDTARSQQINNLLRDGVVTEVDHARARCRVRTGEVHTDFIPWLAAAAGALIVWAPPGVGEQVLVLCGDGDLANAVALRGLYSEAFEAPSDSANVTLLRFADGALITYDSAAHALAAVLPAGGTVAITADGGVSINGPVTINGETTITGNVAISGKADVSEDVVGGGISLKNHLTTNVQPGSGKSGPPA